MENEEINALWDMGEDYLAGISWQDFMDRLYPLTRSEYFGEVLHEEMPSLSEEVQNEIRQRFRDAGVPEEICANEKALHLLARLIFGKVVGGIAVKDYLSMEANAATLNPDGETQMFLVKKNEDSVTLIRYISDNLKNVSIPAQINGKPVTVIGESCFEGHKEIRHVSFPDTLTDIGDFAFRMCKKMSC